MRHHVCLGIRRERSCMAMTVLPAPSFQKTGRRVCVALRCAGCSILELAHPQPALPDIESENICQLQVFMN